MTFHKRNLLDAFQDAGDVDPAELRQPEKPRVPEEPPAAPEEPSDPPEPTAEAPEPAPAFDPDEPVRLAEQLAPRARRKDLLEEFDEIVPPSSGMPAWLPWVATIGVAFVLGIAVGRGTIGSEVSAGGDGEEVAEEPEAPDAGLVPAGGGAVSAPKPAAGPAGERRSPLFDPANQWTVVVATYSRTAEEFAWATHDHMRDAKLPVFTPVEVGDMIVVLAGAAPRSGDLAALEAQIKELSRRGQKGVYEDAYRERIDNLIDRD